MIKLFFLASLLLLSIQADMPPQQPVIGVYTQDAESFLTDGQNSHTYIAASYVKNL